MMSYIQSAKINYFDIYEKQLLFNIEHSHTFVMSSTIGLNFGNGAGAGAGAHMNA